MSDLFPQWWKTTDDHSLNSWRKWYLAQRPHAIDEATKKVMNKLQVFKQRLNEMDDKLVQNWIEDLVFVQTYNGLQIQVAILDKLSFITGKDYRLATKKEEAKGIDGVVGNVQLSIKPDTYRLKANLQENIEAPIVYYSTDDDQITVEIDDKLLGTLKM